MIKKRSRLTGKAARPLSLSLSLALLSFSIKTISGNLSHRGAHLHSLPGLLFISHICVSVRVCEKLLPSSDHLSCYHRLFNLLRKFSWNLRPVLRFKTFIFPEQSSSYQSAVGFSLLGSYEEDPWTVEMR